MTRPGEDTDIIPALRPHDTPDMPLPLPHAPGRHRHRRQRWSPLAWIAVIAPPAAVAAGFVGWSLPDWLPKDRPAAVVSPTRESASPDPVVVAPSRTGHTGADRSRPRRTRQPEFVAPAPRHTRTNRPSPTPTPSTSKPSPSPRPTTTPTPTKTTTSPTPSSSTSPTATATASNGKLGAPDVR